MHTLHAILFCLMCVVTEEGYVFSPLRPCTGQEDEFKCPDPPDECALKSERCDDLLHCFDLSDEENCAPRTCPSDQFQCRDFRHMCIPRNTKCDGTPHCPDYSDEYCQPGDCPPDTFYCPTGICIPEGNTCNGLDECGDFFDERNCPPKNCTEDEFQCKEYQNICVLNKQKCDGVSHCPDSSDENCQPGDCTSEQFFCPEGYCIPKNKRCDGKNECWDWTDEENCEPDDCAVDTLHCPRRACIPIEMKCNGLNNCEDWADEANCPLSNCTGHDFRCSNGRCVRPEEECDGFNTCGDWSDELHCPVTTYCTEFRCQNDRCIGYNSNKCNGFNDCGDWSDEDDCDCMDDWVRHRGRCYKTRMFNKNLTWLEAKRHCENDDSVLASVRGPDDDEFLVNTLPNNSKTFYIGLQKKYDSALGTFQGKLRWDDGSTISFKHWKDAQPDGGALEQCTVMEGADGWKDIFCGESAANQFVCMRTKITIDDYSNMPTALPVKNSTVSYNLLKSCKSGELTSRFKFCDGYDDCRDGSDEGNCGTSCKNAQYRCENTVCISLNFYCDGINDCGDNSDEDNCNICRDFQCYEGRCIPKSWVNDGVVDCDGYEGEDEAGALSVTDDQSACLYGANEFGKVSFKFPATEKDCVSFPCPDMDFKCPFSYCIPVMLVCDGKTDCPSGEDELHCNGFVCHGRYRCQGRTFCINPSQVCDGVRHCPIGDDERYCPKAHCPPSCECDGRVIRCDQNFSLEATISSDARKLNLSGVDMSNGSLDLSDLYYLTVLDLSHCRLATIKGMFINNPNIVELDLSNNALQRISETSLSSLTRLKYLDLSNNILLTVENGAFLELSTLKRLNLRNTKHGNLDKMSFTGLSGLLQLNLANSTIKKIKEKPLSDMPFLRDLDLRHNYVEQFSCCFLKSLETLQNMYTHSYQFCCDSMRPNSLKPDSCRANVGDAISSCKDLLATNTLRAMLWFIVLFAMFGNLAVLAYRFKYDRASLKRSYGIFVTNLSISDCLMGVYMLIIGGADVEYSDKYVSVDYGWRHSPVCKFAGFLSTLSSEASCIFISLITLDRFLVIKYPFGQVKFSCKSTVSCIVITWIVAAALAAVPLLPSLDHWQLYSQNSVCLALPLSNERTPGWQYSTIIFIGFNFILFLFIGVGQIAIYRELTASPKIRGGGSNDAKVARRLFLVVFTDFLCWVPVGVMGIMILHGIPIDKDVFAWTAVTVLPINSALNPVLYSLPGIRATWKKSSKQNQKSARTDTGRKDTPVPDRPAFRNSRLYVGKRTDDMERLGDVMKCPEVSPDVRCVLLSEIITYIYDLKRQNRKLEAVTDKNIFISRCGEDISAVCLSLKPDEDRYWQVEDIFYLANLLSENTTKMKWKDARKCLRDAITTRTKVEDRQPQQCQRRGSN